MTHKIAQDMECLHALRRGYKYPERGDSLDCRRRPRFFPRPRRFSDKEQYERFQQAARELGADESEEAFERAFRRVVKPDRVTRPGPGKSAPRSRDDA
jgi:hypothetical protein